MAERVCRQCGAVLQGDRPRFCQACGCEQTEAAPAARDPENAPAVAAVSEGDGEFPHGNAMAAASAQERETLYLEKAKSSLSESGDLAPEAIEELKQLASQLGIDQAGSERLMNAAIESLRPNKTDDLDEPSEPETTKGLSLSVNINRFYMAGFDGVLDVRLENLSDEVYDCVDIIASGNLLGRTEKWSCRFEACGDERELFEVRPDSPGVKIIRFQVDARQGDAVQSYRATCDLPVFDNTQNLQDIKLQADNMVNVSAGTGKQMGNSINNNIQIMLDQGKIRDANGLMMEYRGMPSRYVSLALKLDPNRSDDLTTAWKQKHAGTRVLEAQRGSLTESASLWVKAKGRPVNTVLVARPRVTLGKNRRNDIVARICPRSPANDHQSNQMSRNHCYVTLTERGILVGDEGSANGTFLNGRRLSSQGEPVVGSRAELDLAEALKLAVRIIAAAGAAPRSAYDKVSSAGIGPLWDLAERAGVDAVMLERLGNLDPDDTNGCEAYCLIYRLVTIGSGQGCALRVTDKGLEPEHAAIVYLCDRFYLENRSDLTDVIVNDRTLSKSELMPLSFGDRIHVGRLEMEFAQRSQLFVDL